MFKPLVISAVALSAALAPLATGVHADVGGFERVVTEAVWHYDGYSVERLPFATGALGPYTLGGNVFIAEPTGACGASGCERYDLVLLNSGSMKRIQNVPAGAFSPERVEKNGTRLVYAIPTGLSDSRWNVKEVNLATGEVTDLLTNVFFAEATKIDVFVEGKNVFFQVEMNHTNTNKAFKQAAVYVYDYEEQKARPPTERFQLNREEIQDVFNGEVLVKMVFPNGDKQLWFMDAKIVDARRGKAVFVPTSYTISSEDLVAAHYLSNGSIEYFQFYTRHTYNPKLQAEPTNYPGQTITWFRPIKDAYQIKGNRMAWIDAEDRLSLSTSGAAKFIGNAAFGRFLLTSTELFSATANGGSRTNVFDIASAPKQVAIGITGVRGNKAVGINAESQVAFLDRVTGVAHDIGRGTSAAIGADNRPYWKGVDGRIYAATMKTSILIDTMNPTSGIYAVKAPGSKTVYLVKNEVRFVFNDEVTFFTYFKNFSGVKTISVTELNAIPFGGVAPKATVAAGTLVRIFGDTKNVYVLGSNNTINRIASPDVALQLFGADWPTKVIQLTEAESFNVRLGGIVQTARDLANL